MVSLRRHMSNVPILEVRSNDRLVEEDEQSAKSILVGDKTAEAQSSSILPDLDPLTHSRVGNSHVDSAVGRGRRRRQWSTSVDACLFVVVTHTHHKRVLSDGVSLTKKNGVQCLAEESLTFFRDGVCGASAARASLETRALRRRRSPGGRPRGARYASAYLKPTTPLLV